MKFRVKTIRQVVHSAEAVEKAVVSHTGPGELPLPTERRVVVSLRFKPGIDKSHLQAS
jgi:hypothetical protein